MENIESKYKIKPVVKKKNLFQLITFATIIILPMILYVSFESGRFNLGMFIFQSITMAIIILSSVIGLLMLKVKNIPIKA